MRKNTGFTLVEVLVAVALTGMILLTGYSAFQQIMQSQGRLGAIIDVQKNLFYTNEKLADLIREGGTLDYEEYFNRRMLGYTRSTIDTSDADTVADSYTFTNLSHFGNGNISSGRSTLYYCGVTGGSNGEGCMVTTPPSLFDSSQYPSGSLTLTNNFTSTPPEHQPYGQYAGLAFNYLDPVGYPMPIKLPPIFKAGAQVGIFTRGTGVERVINKNVAEVGLPELYLIKKNLDNTYERTYFRHVYVDDPFVTTPTCDPTLSTGAANINGCLGKIQITKLDSCDTVGTADGIIDAWIPQCDFNVTNPSCSNLATYRTATCPTTAANIYKSALETDIAGPTPTAASKNLTWVDVTAPEMNVIRATFLPNPLKIPSLMIGAGEKADAPRVSVYLEVVLSTRLRNKSFVKTDKNYPRTLITTYDLSE